MARSKMLSGTPILEGDNTVPGLKIHKEVLEQIPAIEKACKEMGLDYYPIIVEFVRYDEMAELASYGGFPNRYPHWKWGQEYEELSRGYEYNQYRISEMVINTNPCYIYCMDSNTLVDNVDVIAHAIGHNDFFKNNVYFAPTDDNMMNKLANHGTRIRNYMARWGYEPVTEFIDQVIRIDTLIDTQKAWRKKTIKNAVLKDERTYRHPNRLHAENNYMEGWVNSKEYLQKEHDRIEKEDAADFLDLFGKPDRDIFGYLKNNAPLKPWQQDIISMLYEESMYFAPQRLTKMLNEGWASFVDFHLLCRKGLAALGQKSEDAGIFHYAEHKMRVLGGKWSTNPYKLGFELLLDIESRWNKGKFGQEWDDVKDMKEKEEWNKHTNQGLEKIFEVRKFYNDYTALQEFFTPELCAKLEFFNFRKFPSGDHKITDRDFEEIKSGLLKKYMNGGLPDIRLCDPNHLNKGWFFIQHFWDDRPLYHKYVLETIIAVQRIWQNNVVLATRNSDGDEFVYLCDGPDPTKNVQVLGRDEYEDKYGITLNYGKEKK